MAYTLVGLGVLGGNLTASGLSAQVFYFANYFGVFFDSGQDVAQGTGILWSLAVEEHFYLVWPVLLLALLTWLTPVFLYTEQGKRDMATAAPLLIKRHMQLYFIAATICFGVFLWRIYLIHYSSEPLPLYRIYMGTDTRIDSILYGAILAIIMPMIARFDVAPNFMRPRDWAWFVGGVTWVILGIANRDEASRYMQIGTGLVPVFYYAVLRPLHWLFRWLQHPSLRILGIWSYSIYLIHDIVIRALQNNGLQNRFAILALTLVFSCVFAYLVTRYVDAWAHRTRGRILAARQPETAPL